MNKGFLPINKPKDWTSFDVVNKVKHILHDNKVGHLGTLDPMATGVLVLTIGKATKLFDLMQVKKKTYIAKFKFGLETDTLDITGNVINRCERTPNLDKIKSILPKFIGEIEQIPPKFSAKSINGKRAYNLARENVDFELKPSIVNIERINVISYLDSELKLEITCGSGTYIRALGRDIAYMLNNYATMTELVRTNVGNLKLSDCFNIDELNSENISSKIIKIRDILGFKVLNLEKEISDKLINGQVVSLNMPNGDYLLNGNVDTIAIVKIRDFKAKMSIFLGI